MCEALPELRNRSQLPLACVLVRMDIRRAVQSNTEILRAKASLVIYRLVTPTPLSCPQPAAAAASAQLQNKAIPVC